MWLTALIWQHSLGLFYTVRSKERIIWSIIDFPCRVAYTNGEDSLCHNLDVCSLSGHLKITDNKSICPNMTLVIDSWLQ